MHLMGELLSYDKVGMPGVSWVETHSMPIVVAVSATLPRLPGLNWVSRACLSLVPWAL